MGGMCGSYKLTYIIYYTQDVRMQDSIINYNSSEEVMRIPVSVVSSVPKRKNISMKHPPRVANNLKLRYGLPRRSFIL